MLQTKRKILILSAPIGSGHQQAAQALAEAFRKDKACEVFLGSAFDFFPTFIGNIFIKLYLMMLHYFPEAYAMVYKWGNNTSGSLWLRSLINMLLAKLADSYFREIRPDVVIATHATPAGIVDIYKKKHPKLMLASVVTDFTVHKWWLCDRTNTYFLAAEDIMPNVEPKKWQKVYYYGLPVRSEFAKGYNKDYLHMKYGWKRDDRICLLMGGGEGLLPMEDLISAIIFNYDKTLKFVAVTGNNYRLARELKRLPYDITVLGFVQTVAELMNAADYLITKAGGMTAAEAMTTSVKYIIYDPFPGQETANAKYLEKIGAAKIARTPFEVARTIREYDNDNNLFLGAMGRPLAAEYIVEAIIRELD